MSAGDITRTSLDRLVAAASLLGVRAESLSPFMPEPSAASEGRVGLLDYARMGQRVIAQSGRGELGLEVARVTEITHMGFGGLAAMSAPTLGQALALMTRYEPLSVRSYRGQSRWLPADGKLLFYSIAPYNDFTRFIVDGMLATWSQMITRFAGADCLREAHVEFAAPAYHARYAELFPCPVFFAADENALLLNRGAAARPLRGHDAALHAELVALAEQRLRQLETESQFRQRVQKILGPMLRGSTPSLEQVADALGMASWTLRRKLKEEDTSFQELLDEMRRDLALAYMKDVSLSLGEIAYILGFSTPGAFQRAFKRWTTTTPGEYRRGLRGAPASLPD
jgi:AraC-like DNA-binding protein